MKAEMSMALPKHRAKEPIDLDIVLVCRKGSARQGSTLKKPDWNGDLWGTIRPKAADQIVRLRGTGRKLSRNDIKIVVMAQLIHQLSRSHTIENSLSLLETGGKEIEDAIARLHDVKDNKPAGGCF